MAFNQTWNDAFEDVPADGDQIKFGADKIRDLKEGVRERLQIDHEVFTADGAGTDTGTDSGYHKKVTLKVATPGTAPSGYIELGAAADEFYWKGNGGTLRTVVDTAKAQTLSSKTLSSPTLNTPTINNGTLGSPGLSGGTINNCVIGGSTPAVGSFSTVNASSVAATAISGALTGAVGSSTPSTGAFTTLSASGAATLTSTLGVSGVATLSAGAVLSSGTIKIKYMSGTLSMSSGGSLGYFANIAHSLGTAVVTAIGSYTASVYRFFFIPLGTAKSISVDTTNIQLASDDNLTGYVYHLYIFHT